jgi:large conductance mechanosensitive channel
MSIVQEFKKWIMRGNLVELAIAFIIGAVFANLVKAFIGDLITPIIALIVGKPNFEDLSFTINSSHFLYGDFINYLISFLSVAAAVFFFVVQPVNALMRRHKTEPDVESETRPCTECLSDIPKLARRCAFCTAPQEPIAGISV